MNIALKFFSVFLSLIFAAVLGVAPAGAVDLNPANYPQSLDKCTKLSKTEAIIGYAKSKKKFLYLRCYLGDGKLHPDALSPELNQKTLKPIIVARPFVTPKPVAKTRLLDDGTGSVEIIRKSLSSIRNRVAQGSKIELIPYFDSQIPKVYRDAAMQSASAFIDSYGDLFVGKSKLYLLFSASPKNILASYTKIAKIEQVPNLVNDTRFGLERNTKKSTPTEFIGASGITSPGYKDFSLVSLFYNPTVWDRDRMFIVPGEMKHALFYTYGNVNMAPCFLTPGMAGLFGAAFSFPAEGEDLLLSTFLRNHADFRQIEGKKLFNFHDLSILDGNDTLAFMPGSECGVDGDFIPTAVAASLLVGKYGADKVFEYMREFSLNPKGYAGAFKKVYGITTKEFFTEAAGFISWYKSWYYKTYLNKPVPIK